ncbi:MAG TPA: LuxR C-terminal-related transcriptional regulator [Thermomicrobiales bacterium]|nr:LuxR C-terminal-related transcriptional regulator [Thermomicrobiales bacterium]
MSMLQPDDGANHLPVPRTSLVGREEDAERVEDLLLSPDVSLVTIVGPGGAGKTRLALKVAEDLENAFRDGVWFAPLSTISDPKLVSPTIAQAIGMRERSGDSVEEQLRLHLRDAEMLIVLDNFEQVRESAVQIARLLQACRGLKILVTSRVILRLSAEHVYPISGLRLPGAEEAHDVAGIVHNEAVRLFVARAQSSDPAFRLDTHNAEAVVGICRQLDGLPLGIELAAARVRTLSPQALHARLSRRLTVLGSRFQDVPDRHRTIGTAVDWSVQLLTPAEQVIFHRLSVFSGSFSLAAAEVVAGVELGTGTSDLDVLDALGSLVDQSLLRHVSESGDEESRFRMLRVVREVALENLEASGELEDARRRHAEYFLALAEEAAPHLTGPEQVRWLNELERSLADLRAAMTWFGQAGEHALRLRLVAALWRFGYTRGHLTEAREWLRTALLASPEKTQTRAVALNGKGLLASSQGHSAVATACHEEALELSREAGDEYAIAVALNGLGDAAAVDGDRTLARERYEGALQLFRKVGHERGVAGAHTNLGNLAWDAREYEEAVAHHQQAAVHYEAAGDLRGTAWSASNLGTLAVQQGQYGAATRYLRDAMGKYTELGDPVGVMETLEGFAGIALARKQASLATTLYAVAQVIRERIGIPIAAADRERHKALVERMRGELGASFDMTWAAGRAMSGEEAMRLALATDSGAEPSSPQRGAATTADSFRLTRREIEILQLIAVGKTNKEISDELSISYRTVSTHVSNVLGKLDLANRSALASFAHREGLV